MNHQSLSASCLQQTWHPFLASHMRNTKTRTLLFLWDTSPAGKECWTHTGYAGQAFLHHRVRAPDTWSLVPQPLCTQTSRHQGYVIEESVNNAFTSLHLIGDTERRQPKGAHT